jgi:O-antigen/teichoic acid export membrane protein/ubiquinone/menaquinone biosynthesis C-methylase UbiE
MRNVSGGWPRLRASASARAVGQLFSAEVFALGGLTLQALLTARYLGPSLFGRWSVVVGLAALVVALLDMRSADAITRFLPQRLRDGKPDEATTLVSVCLTADAAIAALTTAVVLGVAAVAPPLAPLPTAQILLVVVGAVAILPTLSGRAVLNVNGRYATVARLQIAGIVLRLGGLAPVILLDLGLLGLLIVTSGGVALECVVTVAVAARALREKGSRRPIRLVSPRQVPRDVRSFIGWNGAVTLSGAVVKAGDVVLVGAVAGATAAGYYRLARTLAMPVASLATPLQTVFYNSLSNARSRGTIDWRALIVRAQLVVVPIVVVVVAVVPAVDSLVRLLAGDEFAPAGAPAVWFLLGNALSLLGYWGRPVLLVLDHLRPNLWSGLILAVLFVLAAVPAAQAHGAEGAALARLVVVSLLGNIVLAALVRSAVRRDGRARSGADTADARARWPAARDGSRRRGRDTYARARGERQRGRRGRQAAMTEHAVAAYVSRPVNPQRMAALQAHAGARVLDVGCGNGAYVFSLRDRHDTVGLDWARLPAWDEAPESFVVGSAQDLPFADSSFDTVACFETLEHLPDPGKALSELRRVARKNVVLTVPNCEVSPGQRASGLIFHHWIDPTHRNFWTHAEFVDLVAASGFDVLHAERINQIDLRPLVAEAFGRRPAVARLLRGLLKVARPRAYGMTTLVVARPV